MAKQLFRALVAFGLAIGLALPAMAQLTHKLSGQVRVDYDVMGSSQLGGKIGGTDAGEAPKSISASGVARATGDTHLTYVSTYIDGDTTATGSVRFFRNGEKRFTLEASTTDGDWTGSAFTQWEEFWSADGSKGDAGAGSAGPTTLTGTSSTIGTVTFPGILTLNHAGTVGEDEPRGGPVRDAVPSGAGAGDAAVTGRLVSAVGAVGSDPLITRDLVGVTSASTGTVTIAVNPAATKGSNRDSYVTLSNDQLTFQLGYDQYFSNQYKGGDYLLFGAYHDRGGLKGLRNGLGDYARSIDNRIEAFSFNFKASDDMNVGIIYGSGNNGSNFGEFGAILTTQLNGVNLGTAVAAPATKDGLMGLEFEFTVPDTFDLRFEYGSASAKGDANVGGTNTSTSAPSENYKSTAGWMALGATMMLDPMNVSFNYTSSSDKQTPTLAAVASATDLSRWESTEVDTGRGLTEMVINLDYTIDDTSGVSFAMANTSFKKPGYEYAADAPDAVKVSSMSLGYANTVGNVKVSAGYQSDSYKGGVKNSVTDGAKGSTLRVRFDYSF